MGRPGTDCVNFWWAVWSDLSLFFVTQRSTLQGQRSCCSHSGSSSSTNIITTSADGHWENSASCSATGFITTYWKTSSWTVTRACADPSRLIAAAWFFFTPQSGEQPSTARPNARVPTIRGIGVSRSRICSVVKRESWIQSLWTSVSNALPSVTCLISRLAVRRFWRTPLSLRAATLMTSSKWSLKKSEKKRQERETWPTPNLTTSLFSG